MGIARHGIWLAGAAAMGITGHATAIAAPATTRDLHVPAGTLASSLLAIGKSTDTEIQFRPEDVEGIEAPALNGDYSAENAVRAVTGGTALKVEIKDGSIFIRGRSKAHDVVQTASSDIIVTGTRIRGGSVASSVIQLSQDKMRDEGFESLTDVVRSIPQNFSGGQMPGIGLNANNSLDETGGASMNLRGIGPDATLTLLNGHRMSYSGDSQAIDISSIPFLALDRIEIVPDGASALYGSDAVAGVANIILKRDYSGITVSSDWGGSTEGGNNSQRYGLLGGTHWASGSVTAAYEYGRNTPIFAEDRSYTRDLNPGLWLFPAQHHNNEFIDLRQDIANDLTFTVDAIYNSRYSDQRFAIDDRGQYLLNGVDKRIGDHSLTIAPALKWRVNEGWTVDLSGSYGWDHSRLAQDEYYDKAPIYQTRICFCNSASSVELGANGKILKLPGGNVNVALGVGYRENGFRQTNFNINASQRTYYAYGELDLPFVAPQLNIPWVNRFLVTAALRYERYPDIDNVLTPKIGLIYSPAPGLDLKGSWGKSFKAPTLYQRYFAVSTGLYSASTLGAQGYPAASTALYILGGNPELKPERATTWSTTLMLHPSAVPGLKVEATVFGIAYRDRVITPIDYVTQALSNAIYGDLVEFSPSDADKAAAVSEGQAGGGFLNYSSAPYDPANVIAIVRNNNVNAARQSICGIDASIEYKLKFSSATSALFSGSGTYLDSHQKRTDLQPTQALAGTIFNPPHFRGRLGVTVKSGNAMISSFVNYIGGLSDIRSTPEPHIHSMTTWDLSARYRIPSFRLARDIEFGIAIANLANAKPDTIAISAAYETAYDSTNYSSFGRSVTGSLQLRW